MSKDTICSLLWNHLYLSNEGYFLPCCSSNKYIQELKSKSTTIIKKENFSQIHNLPFIQEIRRDMLSGVKNKFCSDCYEQEEKGIVSYRQLNNELFSETFTKLIKKELEINSEMSFEYIDLRLGNTCNLACRMCPAESSSNLIKDLVNLEGKVFSSDFFSNTNWHTEQIFWDKLLEYSAGVKKIYLAGGEPFLIKESWEFLHRLIELDLSKNITIYYSTNLTTIPKDAYKIWPHFKKVILSLSIDSIEDSYEYIRYPAKWDRVHKNIKKMDKDFLELNIESAVVYSTVQAYNYNSIPKLYKFLKQFKNIDHYPIINILKDPTALSINNIPREIRVKEISHLKRIILEVSSSNYKSKKWKKNFINELIELINQLEKNNQESIDNFKKYTTYFDKTRSQDIFSIIPELKNYF